MLASLGEDQFAIFAAPDGSYVQVVGADEPGHLRCEAADFDQWPSSERAMTDEMLSRLEELGFEPQHEANYALVAPARDTPEVHRLAGLLARTLHDVYGVRADEQLEITVDT